MKCVGILALYYLAIIKDSKLKDDINPLWESMALYCFATIRLKTEGRNNVHATLLLRKQPEFKTIGRNGISVGIYGALLLRNYPELETKGQNRVFMELSSKIKRTKLNMCFINTLY